MEEMRTRARDLLPTVLLTLLSIVQALSLEVLWTSVKGSDHLWSRDMTALIGWLQVFAVVQGIALVWIFYTSIVMRYRWVPTTRDSIIPFALGIMEFVLAEALAPRWLPAWFVLLAAIFAYSTWVSVLMFDSAAKEDPHLVTEELRLSRTLRNQVPAFVFVGTLVLMGGATHLAGPSGWVALAGVTFANFALLAQTLMIRRFWNRSMGIS